MWKHLSLIINSELFNVGKFSMYDRCMTKIQNMSPHSHQTLTIAGRLPDSIKYLGTDAVTKLELLINY